MGKWRADRRAQLGVNKSASGLFLASDEVRALTQSDEISPSHKRRLSPGLDEFVANGVMPKRNTRCVSTTREDPMKYLVRVSLLAIAIGLINGHAWPQHRPRTVGQTSPGNPWTAIIPDPDEFDWSAHGGSRTGYDFRGMLPKHGPFYDYIQDKRKNDLPVTWAEEALVRHLITIRRWPDPPAPNPFWSACMRYLRTQRNSDLSVAEMILLDQLSARGLTTKELPDDPNLTRVRDYLNSAPFEIQNWFERMSARHETWIENLNSGWGYDMPYDTPYDPAVVDEMKVQVRDTLSFLNDRNNSLGREIESMQNALAAGDAAWQEHVAQRTKELGDSKSAEFSQYQELEIALTKGGDHWRQYVEANSATDTDEGLVEVPTSDTGASPKDEATRAAELTKRAGAYSEKKDYEHAVLAFTQALDTEPRSAESYAGRGLAKAALNDIEGATADISRALKLDPNCVSAYRNRSIIKLALADPNGAVADASRAIELEPTNPRNYLTRGLAYESRKDYGAAVLDYTVAIDLNPQFDRAYLYRGLARLKSSRVQESIADFDKAISMDPNDSVAYLNRAVAKENLGDLNASLSDYQEALRINPQDAAARQGLNRLKIKK
jgi:tetratricopeptide (TPR) repeat protein